MADHDHESSIPNLGPGVESLSTYFAKTITGRHNQHVLIRITGRAGKGKSWTGLSLAEETAEKIAKIKGGKPEDYFTPKNDLGVMAKSEIMRVMKNPKKYTVKFLDDVAVAWNARNYKDKFNIDLNDLIQTFRPNNNLVIMTMQSGFLIDKVPRSLIHYQAEMAESNFDKGYNMLKVFEISLSEDNGKIYKHYLQGDGAKFVRHIVKAPPEDVTTAYEIERATQLERMAEEKEKDKQERQAPVPKREPKITTDVTPVLQEMIDKKIPLRVISKWMKSLGHNISATTISNFKQDVQQPNSSII